MVMTIFQFNNNDDHGKHDAIAADHKWLKKMMITIFEIESNDEHDTKAAAQSINQNGDDDIWNW